VNSNSLWTLLDMSHRVINKTSPNLTTECWLCFNAKPPYFEAIGIVNGPQFANGLNPEACKWENNTQGISLQQVPGQGRCVG
ncbi:ENV1 protein, partial [Caloenas nicobarica]|nr:ENV1 protein [Caloenas nicobarica]